MDAEDLRKAGNVYIILVKKKPENNILDEPRPGLLTLLTS